MYIASHEWTPPRSLSPQQPSTGSSASLRHVQPSAASLYRRLLTAQPDAGAREEAAGYLRHELTRLHDCDCDLPGDPQELQEWMHAGTAAVTARYSLYLEERRGGAPRRYFSNRSHALYFLRNVAPTKLVDGAWLYGMLAHWANPRYADLVRTYVEELGEGLPDKNHVLLYRQLLARHDLESLDDLDDEAHRQGLVQLALGWNAAEFLPELIGFNLGYEQLPLHLLITAYELNELGLDPYYFTLHVTVDNSDTGHARRACQAVLDTLPQIGDPAAFWRRVRNGSQLGDLGRSSTQIIAGFDIEQEVVRILSRKSSSGRGAHSDYCQVAGRKVNDWLSQPEQVPGFLRALEASGWIRRGEPVAQSRFWSLLQGERAEMFGVFTSYELQVIHDWIRGRASTDGRPWTEEAAEPAPTTTRRRSFRAAARLEAARGAPALKADGESPLLDPDLAALTDQLATADDAGQTRLLVQAMSPAFHWTPAGLHATRLFWERLHG